MSNSVFACLFQPQCDQFVCLCWCLNWLWFNQTVLYFVSQQHHKSSLHCSVFTAFCHLQHCRSKELFYLYFVSPGGCKTCSCKISLLRQGLLHTDRLREFSSAAILKKVAEIKKLIVFLNKRAVGRRTLSSERVQNFTSPWFLILKKWKMYKSKRWYEYLYHKLVNRSFHCFIYFTVFYHEEDYIPDIKAITWEGEGNRKWNTQPVLLFVCDNTFHWKAKSSVHSSDVAWLWKTVSGGLHFKN